MTGEATAALAEYRYADAARVLYEFAWDEFCSFYVEMVKARLRRPGRRGRRPQRVLAHTLDTLLRLLHPMIPFVTEEVWQLWRRSRPARGIDAAEPAAESIMIAPWPEGDAARQRRADRGPVRPFPGGLAGGARDSRPAERAAEEADRLRRPLRRRDGGAVAADGALLRLDGRRPADRLGPGRRRPPP